MATVPIAILNGVMLLSMGQLPGAQSFATRLDALEAAAITTREGLTTGHFEVLISVHLASGGERSSKYRVWFDRDRVRIDRSLEEDTWEKFSVAGDVFYWHTDQGDIVAEMGFKEFTPRTKLLLFDPRCLGLFPYPYEALGHANLIEFDSSSNRRDVSVKESDGLIVATYEQGDPSISVTKHFSTASGNPVTMVRYEWKTRSNRSAVDTVQAEYGDGKVLPTQITYERWLDSKRNVTQIATVVDLGTKSSIPDPVFSFAGMEVPKNTTVLETPAEKGKLTGVWDGEKIDYSGRNPSHSVTTRFSRYWALVIIGSAIAVVCLFLLVKQRRGNS